MLMFSLGNNAIPKPIDTFDTRMTGYYSILNCLIACLLK